MRVIFLLISSAYFFSSCAEKRSIYATPAVHNPMFKQKGENYVSAYYASNGNETMDYGAPLATSYRTSKSNGFSIQGGYAFDNKFGITGGMNHTIQKDRAGKYLTNSSDTLIIDQKHSNYYLAGVFFTHNTSGFVGFNLLAGINAGKTEMREMGISTVNYTNYFEANNISAFLQPSLNFHSTNNFRLGFHMRINYLTHNNIKTSYTPDQLKNYRLSNLSPMLINEVGAKISFGFKAVPALLFDAQLAFIYTNSGYVYSRGANLSTGITYRWNNKTKN
jgi:hypothetical protein